MTTTTDLLRRAAQDSIDLAEDLDQLDGRKAEMRAAQCRSNAASLLALADQMERAEPVAYIPEGALLHVRASSYAESTATALWSGHNRPSMVRTIPLYTHPAPEVTHPLEHLLPELCQLLDAFKREAESNDEGWTEWDESVRARLRKCIADHNIAAMQEPKP